jgi:membrane-associated phospholipid phosphatase
VRIVCPLSESVALGAGRLAASLVVSPRDVDDQVLYAVNWLTRHTPWLHGAALDFATYGVVLFALALLAGVVVARHSGSGRLAAAGWAGLATLIAVTLNQPFGHLFNEARPYAAHPQILRLADPSQDFSFPSDHAVMAGAVAAGLWLVDRRFGAAATVLAVLMAFTRVYIGAHYPWDVLGGLAFGAGITLVGWVVLRRPLTMLVEALRDRPVLRPLFGSVALRRGEAMRTC